MLSPREISSDGQGVLTPTTERIVRKAEVAHVEGATPRSLDINARSPWANLTVDTAVEDPSASANASATTDAARRQERNEMDVAPSASASASAESTRIATPGSTASQISSDTAPPALPKRYTMDLGHWQSPADLPERRLMIQRIIAMTRRKRLDPPLSMGDNGASSGDWNAALAKRVELSLYSRAASFHEYLDLNTLRRRLQSLVVLSFQENAASRRELDDHAPPKLGKRKLSTTSTPFGVPRLTIKRPRVGVASCAHVKRLASIDATNSAKEDFFIMDEAVLRHVFAFVPGVDVVRCFALNRFAARVLPTCVATLEVGIQQAKSAFEQFSSSWLTQYPNLTALALRDAHKPSDAQDDGASLHAWGCSDLYFSHTNDGEDVVRHIAESIELGAGRRMRSLRLVAVYTNTCRSNPLYALCAALVKGSCPLLEDLLVGGNGISDEGAVDIAWLLRVGSLPLLSRLDVRRNYIGEAGLNRVMSALAVGQCPNLKYLCMGGNIVTDNCVTPIVDLLSSGACPQMRFLGLEDNFLSTAGVQSVIQAAVAGGMMPKLHHVSSDGRVDEAPIASSPLLSPSPSRSAP